MAEIRSEVVKVRFTKSLYQAMALRARAEERTISEWIRILVAAKLKGHEVLLTPEAEPAEATTSMTEKAVDEAPVSDDQTRQSTDEVPVPEPTSIDSDDDLASFLAVEFKSI